MVVVGDDYLDERVLDRQLSAWRGLRDLYLLDRALVLHAAHVAVLPHALNHGLQETRVTMSDTIRPVFCVLRTLTVEAFRCIPLHPAQQESLASSPRQARRACTLAASWRRSLAVHLVGGSSWAEAVYHEFTDASANCNV